MQKRHFVWIAVTLILVSSILLAQNSAEDIIRVTRASSNAAIAGRDLETLHQTWVEDLYVTASGGGVFKSGQEMAAAFAAAFEDPEFVTYVRSPTRVSISQGGSFAAEHGEWVGTWNREDGEMQVNGVYLAQWQKREGFWRIRSEVFVALTCEGSASCADRR